MKGRGLYLPALGLVALAISSPSFPHGLLMKLQSEGQMIAGELYYSNGQRAGGEWIEQFDEAVPDIALKTIQAGSDGTFRLPGQAGHRYRVRATGEEGHEIVMTIGLEKTGSRGRMVPDEGGVSAEATLFDSPAWIVLGGFLALSAIPAYFLRKREQNR